MRSLLRSSTNPHKLCPACSTPLIAPTRARRQAFATATSTPATPQTFIEKVVQNHAVDLAPSKRLRAGDFVMIKPQHCMTHDNTGPVISKCASVVAQ